MTELAKDMGVKLKFVPTEWKTLINGIIADKYDISTSASVAPQRIRTVGFTKSYYQVTTVPLTLKKNLAQFKDWEDISYPSVTLKVTLGTSQEQYVENVFSPINHRFAGADPQGQRTHRDCLPAFRDIHGSGFGIFDSYPDCFMDGAQVDRFQVSAIEDHVSEMRADWSFAKFPYLSRLGFPDGIFHVGPLARAFFDDSAINLPELEGYEIIDRARASRGVHIEYIDVLRLAEIFWAATRIKKLLLGIDLSQVETIPIDPEESGKGIGVIEAPRGVLIHSYTINRGRIERLKLLVATQFNNPLINLIIKDLAESHLEQGSLSENGQEAIGRCIRLFDPCLTCATH